MSGDDIDRDADDYWNRQEPEVIAVTFDELAAMLMGYGIPDSGGEVEDISTKECMLANIEKLSAIEAKRELLPLGTVIAVSKIIGLAHTALHIAVEIAESEIGRTSS